jgi:hypothetical protein
MYLSTPRPSISTHFIVVLFKVQVVLGLEYYELQGVFQLEN